MKRITGIISFIGSGIGLIYLIGIFFDEQLYDHSEDLVLWFGLFVLSISILHYCLSNRFWTSKPSVLDNLERENEIIKKKIEKRELLERLENLERK